jgi:hypothetical protein
MSAYNVGENAMRLDMSVVTKFTLVLACSALFIGCASLGGGGAKNPFVGTWNLTVDSPIGTFRQELVIDKALTGVLRTEALGSDWTVGDVTVEGNEVSFTAIFEIEDEDLPAEFTGTIDGDSITGRYDTDEGSGTVTGTRLQV